MKSTASLAVLARVGTMLWWAACVGFWGCGLRAEAPAHNKSPSPPADGSSEGEKKMAIQLISAAFTQGHPIPKKYTGEGTDVSPPLVWQGAPEGTKELALICDDPDAPTAEPWVHWVIYKIPADAKGLPEGLPRKSRLKEPPGALQGKNSWSDGDNIGYRGPYPPPGHGVHHYYFKLYALSAPLTAEPGLTKKALLERIRPLVLAEGVLMGTYERKN